MPVVSQSVLNIVTLDDWERMGNWLGAILNQFQMSKFEIHFHTWQYFLCSSFTPEIGEKVANLNQKKDSGFDTQKPEAAVIQWKLKL